MFFCCNGSSGGEGSQFHTIVYICMLKLASLFRIKRSRVLSFYLTFVIAGLGLCFFHEKDEERRGAHYFQSLSQLFAAPPPERLDEKNSLRPFFFKEI